MSIKKMKEEIWILSRKNKGVDFWLDIEKRRKLRYDYLVSVGMVKEAKDVADSILALKINDKIVGITELEKKYNRAISQLEDEDQALASMLILKGMSIKEIARKRSYTYQYTRSLFCGWSRNGKHKEGIYDKLYKLLK